MKTDECKAAFAKEYKTDEWQVVRDRNCWIDNYKAVKAFFAFRGGQEKLMGDLLRELGLLK
ncbi:hypothetical protein UF37_16085 [Vibrio parahaemolyticus]|nr:hypothetical protein UF37_16085 [Vibrio parahaemolyticus]